MASVFLYHVVGDLTVGKPELSEFAETETVEAAIQAIGESTEGGIPVWKKHSQKSVIENAETRQQRFVGILNSLDIVAFLAREECLKDHDKAMNTPVSQVVVPNYSALKVVDPGTRLIDALEMMKQGVRRLLVPKSTVWRGMSKRFSIFYSGKLLKNSDSFGNSSANPIPTAGWPSSSSSSTSSIQDKFCCLSREDVLRFLIGCLGALAPLPLSTIASLGAINPNYSSIEAFSPAADATKVVPHDPCAVAVVETMPDDQHKIIGEISSAKLWRCDYLAAAWALANLSAGQFVMGVEENMCSRSLPDTTALNDAVGDIKSGNGRMSTTKPRRFSSRSIGFSSNHNSGGGGRSMYRVRSAPLTCKVTSSLAAVMAQMLSHRASHVWVTEAEDDEAVVGVVGYVEILAAVSRQPSTFIAETQTHPEHQ